MGDRSLIHVYDDDRTTILCTIYRQWDHPEALVEALSRGDVVNGYGKPNDAYNTMGCLAAQVIAALKDGIGGTYLYETGCEGADDGHVYRVLPPETKPGPPVLIHEEHGQEVFRGDPRAWKPHAD